MSAYVVLMASLWAYTIPAGIVSIVYEDHPYHWHLALFWPVVVVVAAIAMLGKLAKTIAGFLLRTPRFLWWLVCGMGETE